MAHDGGVYMPESIPLIPRALFKNIADMSLTDIAYVAGTVLFGSDIPPAQINDIVKQTLNFPIPLVKVTPRIFALELYHGPTGSFKDVGARFLARLIKHYISGSQSGKVNVLVATSGDTGCAVAQGFAGIDNINVFILHPKGRLLRVPSDQFLSPAPNIIPISVRGTFDECQELVRQAYTDEELNRRLILTSANSVNIARLLPQTFYLFHAYARLLQHDENIKNISLAMPCGNLGNLTAALFALSMGLPVNKILAAGRGADRLWGQMQSEHLDVNDFNKRSLATNLARINCLIKEKPSLAEVIDCHTYNDEQISRQILSTYRESGYLMDRNTAMACHALTDSLPAIAISMEKADKSLLSQKPRNTGESFLTKAMSLGIVTGGVLIAAAVMTAYFIGSAVSAELGCAMAFSTLCISRLFHGFNCRSDKSIFKVGLTSNRFSLLAFLAGIIFLVLAVFVPGVSGLFSAQLMNIGYFGISLAIGFVPTLIIQLVRIIREARRK